MRYQTVSYGFGRPWTPGVRRLILATAAVYVLQLVNGEAMVALFGLDTADVFGRLRVWQFVTYMALHGGLLHLLFNLFTLWMFGPEVEERMGTTEFIRYYLLCGVGAGLAVWGTDALMGQESLTVGASGAIFGVLLAYGVFFARRPITLLVFFVLPVTMEARVFVALFALLELLLGVSSVSPAGGLRGQVAHVAHLGGMLVGFLYLRLVRHGAPSGRGFLSGFRERLRLSSEREDRERLDALLDKINRYGIHTLTDGERKFLARMSKRAH